MRSIVALPLAAIVLLAAAACRDKPSNQAVGAIPGAAEPAVVAADQPIRDSIRARAAARFAARPDSLTAHADSARTLGATSAPLWVIFVGQLQSAAVTDAIRELLPILRREYVETGRIRLAYVNAAAPETAYNARFAAHAAYCGSIGGKFWTILDSIAATRDSWAPLPDPQPRLDSLAVRLGANRAFQ